MMPSLFYRRRAGRRVWGRLLAAGTAILLLGTTIYATAHLRPLLASLAVTRASNMVNRIVSEAVDEAIENGEIRYDQLISFEKDKEGRITAVHSNMAVCNRLQSEILDIILARIDQVSARDLSIPVGTLLGSPLLAGRGPRISVRMESVGSSSASPSVTSPVGSGVSSGSLTAGSSSGSASAMWEGAMAGASVSRAPRDASVR